MDLTDFDSVKGSDEGAVLYVRHPITNEPTDAWIKLAGPDSKIAKQRRAEIRRMLRDKKQNTLDVDTLEEEANKNRVSLTLDWGEIELDGEKLKFSQENVKKVYERFPWLAEQVDNFQGDRSNFMIASSE